jgi:hypothetical protein
MTAQQTTTTGFATGAQVTLRPVLESDLPELAAFLAANPGEPDRLPWTLQRLKHRFEDKEAPGLWDSKNSKHVFAVLRKESGELLGYLREREDWSHGVYWCHFHLADGLPDLPELTADMLKAYREYKQAWHDPLRISFDILDCEAVKARELTAAGFELEVRRERMVLWLGQPQAICTHTWISERLQAELVARDQDN